MVTHSTICREVLIVSGVSILNDSVFRKVFKVLRYRIGLHWLTTSLLLVLQHFCSPADTVPPKGGTVFVG